MLRTTPDAETRPGLIVMAKAPRRGAVKTRLAAEVGDDIALEVYLRLLAHTRHVAHATAFESGAAVGWWVAGDDGPAWAAGFDPDADVVAAQHGADLGERMANAFDDAFARGWSPVVMIGCDAPALNARTLSDMLHAVREFDVAIAPASDGGYVSVALKKRTPQLFTGPDWGGADVLATTRKIVERVCLSCREFEFQPDLDTAQDLRGFPAFDPRENAD